MEKDSMKIQLIKEINPTEGDFGIDLRFFKEPEDKDFDLRMWRLVNDKDSHNFIGWVLFNLSKDNLITAETFRPEEVKNIENKITTQKKEKIKGQKILTGLMMIMGLMFVASPLWNSPNAPNLLFAIGGFLISIFSAVAYALIDFDNKEK